MTLKQFYIECSNELEFTECGKFEALCLFNDLINVSKEKIYLDNEEVSDEDVDLIKYAIKRRKNGEPLQYILGKWDFYDSTFRVGEGVLIPRPETEQLVEYALDKLKDIDNPVVLDLCAGTGCIGLTIAKHRPDSKVFLLEKEKKACAFLYLNKKELQLNNAIIIQDDLFTVDLSLFNDADIIISNPPYIKRPEISKLQKEVAFEPITALDGGIDGLDFYRCLSDRWVSKIKPNGYMALECGDKQGDSIVELFNGKYKEKQIIFDFNNIDRFVTFRI